MVKHWNQFLWPFTKKLYGNINFYGQQAESHGLWEYNNLRPSNMQNCLKILYGISSLTKMNRNFIYDILSIVLYACNLRWPLLVIHKYDNKNISLYGSPRNKASSDLGRRGTQFGEPHHRGVNGTWRISNRTNGSGSMPQRPLFKRLPYYSWVNLLSGMRLRGDENLVIHQNEIHLF
jgi:hypothetical protein